jgi:hypothetical protein
MGISTCVSGKKCKEKEKKSRGRKNSENQQAINKSLRLTQATLFWHGNGEEKRRRR